MNRPSDIKLLTTLAAIALLTGCARMGQPDGGWYDDTPPRVVHASPADRGVGAKDKKVVISFNEFIKLENAQEKVVISPPQTEMPEIKTKGKSIVVELKDTLRDSTTYTIDFPDAITDNNEGNPMGNYTYCFSTGERIDTMEVSGYVLEASNLEPVKGILVGLYANLSDTIFKKEPMLRVSRTDSRGRFIIRGIHPGTYRAYALQDADGDYIYSQKSEMIAFSHDFIEPTCRPDIRQDTVWLDELHIDSIQRVPYIHYFPDDITLLAFTEELTDRHLIKTERTDERKWTTYFTYGSDSLPRLRGLNFNADSAFVIEASPKNDTINYWLRDTAMVNRDSLEIEYTYHDTDTLGVLQLRTDTILALPKISYEKRQKLLKDKIEQWEKDNKKAKKRGEDYDSIWREEPLHIDVKPNGSLDPDRNVEMESPTPLASLDTAAVHLYCKIDTLWYRSRFKLEPIEGRQRAIRLRAEWRPDVEYSLEIDSAAFRDIYGLASAKIKKGLKVRSMDDYCSIAVELSGKDLDTTIIVELLNSSGKIVKQARQTDGMAEFYYITPGKYYLAAYADTNGNGQWDTGDYEADRQAEKVWYDPKQIECKAKWDLTHQWNLNAKPAYQQKPIEITKQKPDKDKKKRNRNAERAAQKGIPEPQPK